MGRLVEAFDPTRSARAPAAASTVRALVFDMGDVLYDATLWRRWLWQTLQRAGMPLGYRELFEIWDRDFLHDVHCGRAAYRDAFLAFLRSLGLARGLVLELETASQAKARELAAGLRPLPGVKQTLHQLRLAQMPMAVLSDSESPARDLATRLDRLGIGKCFQAIVSSVELGRVKPAAACYLTALNALATQPAEAAFIGHAAEELTGAKAVGMVTIAFNRDDDARADRTIDRFEQLLELLPSPAACAGAA